MDPIPPSTTKSWSIHTRREITSKYEIQTRVGSGAYSDVYKARRLSDDLPVALKEVHDYQSAFREIEALQTLQHSPNVVVLHEYFWSEDEDAVLVLEYLPTDLSSVIRMAKKEREGLSVGEIKRWIIQILLAVDACHRSSIIHRDLKPSNLLISADGVLKLADFGQARIRLAPGFVSINDHTQPQGHESSVYQQVKPENVGQESRVNLMEGPLGTIEEYGTSDEFKTKDTFDEVDKETNIPDVDTSCLATCTTSDVEEDFFKSNYSYEANEAGGNDESALLTSCVGTRWFRAPELLFGSTNYGAEIDLWSLGCIIAELFTLEPVFPGSSDIDQLSRIFTVLGNLSEEVWPGCVQLPDFRIISFSKVENPSGLDSCLPNRSQDEILLAKKLLCFDPAGRATAMELLHDKYLNEEPLPVPVSELRVPSSNHGEDNGSSGSGEWGDHREMDSDSDFDDFGGFDITRRTGGDFSIQFS
ncbi:cyclin-dependent kinase F-1 [Cynara cardunculus var. scolymus]|uniref:cyclin-dependent kinase n=1 Tax=Cynara cardunculus var. scolymus TaxID=59895 RepID=A0A118K0C4_CYNCS|nr:cyclin-dependent kinase F-1 [Cynara cardunculus var. scolymus]KVI01260.1 Protein kinase, ATP binding site-containing protein [Cynara cardunculus var. scolymus]